MGKYIKSMFFLRLSIINTILIILFIYAGLKYYRPCNDKVRVDNLEQITYMDFKKELESNSIDTVYYTDNIDKIYLYFKDGSYKSTNNPKYENFMKDLLESDIIVKPIADLETAENEESTRVGKISVIAMIWGCFLVYFWYRALFSNAESNGKMIVVKNRKKVAIGSNKDEYVTQEKVASNKNVNVKKFEDIAGLCEVKKDMMCLVDFLVNKDKYIEAGAKLPKGVILYGPPGTGKTLLAKAVAGEADVPFLYMSGSEFIEMYVGVGAKRVRELFAKARRQAPCIVFIDEIDAIGGVRTGHDTSGEERKTINALLTEMDGFKETENIIVIAATNRLEDLDPALTRPGRFTNKFCVPLPETISERLEVINLYVKNKKLDQSLDLSALAKETVGFSPAKIEALINEASIISVQEDSKFITKDIIDKAMYKILLQGHMKDDNSERDKEELELVAWHEAGHAIIGFIFGKDITKVTIVSSTSGAGGVTFSTPTKTHLLSSIDIKHEIMELYGGRLAEFIFYDENKQKITTGASNDIERATNLIHDYVTKYGMSDTFGLLNLEKAKMDSQCIVDCEVALAKELEKETLTLLKDNYNKLKEIAFLLLKNETIHADDIKEVFKKVD